MSNSSDNLKKGKRRRSDEDYDATFRSEAIKLAVETRTTKAAKEFGIPSGTLDTWLDEAQKGFYRMEQVRQNGR